ncbi:hypothetical protein PR202_gb24072 [Eleusine coracana subsp. coracana]|uniref:Uncharacterized protein n=1 Tax=Eleusine coracana subsp. coracana TaxID=191504 RepID=A0AAV5FKL0_ELECO|nr:hypothetical protein PR202_gb24072 [Eleusine coracana subsp. coracana]
MMASKRFVTTDLATDIVITVGDVKFYLHKFPLLSKSSRLQTLVASTNEESNDEIDISDIPGGPAAFEICAKFCYGMIVTLNAYNVLAARCAAEYLEMFETIDKGNLIYKIDVFLSASIFRTWKDSIIVLQSTKSLQAWTENLKVINHCVDSIASKASIDPSEVDWSYTYNRKKLPSENGLDSHWNGVRKQVTVPRDWWVEDLCDLEMCLYKKVILAIKAKGRTSSVVIGEALRAYACRRLFSSLDSAVSNGLDCTKHCAALETIISLLPAEKGSVSCSLLLKLLRAACLLGSVETYHDDLVKRIGAELDRASVSDLLIPRSSDDEGMYNVDLVAVMLEEFEHPGLSKSEKKRLCAVMDCKKLSADTSAHAVQNERLPLRVVVQILFFEQLRQSQSSASTAAVLPAVRSILLHREDGTSCGSSMSAATTVTTEDEQWAGVVATTSTSGGDASSLRSVSLANTAGATKKKTKKGGKVAPAPGKRVLGKLWSGKASNGEHSGSDTSESPAGSVNLEETKSTPTRITRHSVS